MDLGEVSFRITVMGEDEARRAMEDHIRDQDRLVQSMDESARAAMRAAEIRERAIQRELKAYDDLVREAQLLKRAYEDLAASFDPVNRAQLKYQRGLDLLDKALKEEIINEQQYKRVLKDLEQQMEATVAAEKLRESQVIANEEKRTAAAIEATSRAYDRLLSSLDPATAATMRFQEARDVAMKALEDKIITENEYNRVIAKAELRRAIEVTKAATQADREAAAETKRLTGEKQRLENELAVFTATVSQTERAQMMLNRAKDLTTRAVEKEIITQERANAIMAETQFRIQSMGHYVNDMGQVMSRNDSAWTRWSRGGIQQAGYQVNDFFVQMQMGTPFMVAFTQQFSQLAGSMGQWGAVVGGVVAIVGAAVSIYMNWGDATKELSKIHDELFDKLRTVDQLMQRLKDNELDQEFGSLTDVVKELTQALLELEKAGSLKELQSTLKSLRETFEPGFIDSIMASFAVAANARSIGAPGRNAPVVTMDSVRDEQTRENFDQLGLGIGYEAFQRIVDEMDAAAKSGDMELVVELVNKMLKESFQDIEGYQKALEGGGAALVTTYAEIAIETAKIAASLNGSAEQAKVEAEAARERVKAEEERAKKVQELREIMGDFVTERVRDEKTAKDASDQYFAAVLRARTESALARREQYDSENSFSSNLIRLVGERAIAEAEAARDARIAAFDVYEALLLVAGVDITQVFEDGEAAADVLLRKVNQLLPVFARIGKLAEAYAEFGSGNVIGLNDDGTAIVRGKYTEGGMDLAVREQGRNRPNPFGTLASGAAGAFNSRSSGGGGGKEQEDALEKLREQIRLEDELLGKSEAYARVVRALGEDRNKYSEQEINNVIREIQALELKKTAMDQVSQITRTMQSSFEEGFMSIMSGTESVEDAFKKMAFNIIQELYRVLVVQQIVGQWNATTGSGTGIVGWVGRILGGVLADGGVMQGGRLTAFAKGGVVDSPTLFPMTTGVGLMGEAGPEAIMPLSRGPDGRLGVQVAGGAASEPPVQVHNHINVPPGATAEAVRAEVVRMLPTITDATTAAVVRARQRGGSMRDAFRS